MSVVIPTIDLKMTNGPIIKQYTVYFI